MEFKYKAVDTEGRMINSTIEATSEAEAINFIRGRNQQVIEIEQEGRKGKDIQLLKKKVKLNDMTVFCKQLATMLNAGIPLSRALEIQTVQTENPVLKETLAQVTSYIKQGMPLSKSMRKFPNVFPRLLLNMIEAGEITGKIDETLDRMSLHYAKENRIAGKIKGAMMYPVVLTGLTVAVILLMLILVLPMFMDMFGSAGADLPGLTQLLIDISFSLQSFWYVYILIIGGTIFGLKRFINTEAGRELWDSLMLKLPIIKGLMPQIITARFTRTLSTLLASGISIVKSLESATETTNNVIVINEMSTVINDVKKGHSVSSLLKRVSVFPPMMISMLSVGEETGAIDEMLEKTADYYDEVLEAAMSRMVALLEPLMIVVMGGSIGVILIAMYLPMFSMFDAMQ